MTAVPSTGVWLFPEAPAPMLVDLIGEAERRGLDEVWLGDEGPAREPFAVLAAASRETATIRLGVGITNPYVRHAAIAATTALTIHELSAGRMILGVGAGGSLSLGPFGLTAEQPVERIREFVDIATAVREGTASAGYEPPDTAIDGSVAALQMPVYVGARGPRLNRLASEIADGAFVAGLPPFRYGEVIAWARQHRPIDIALYPSVAFDEAAIEHHRPEMIWSLLDAPAAVCDKLGVDRDMLAPAAEELRRGNPGPARAIITDALLPQLLLTGTPAAVGTQLAELVAEHRPESIGLALLQADLDQGLADAIAAFDTMRRGLAP